MLKYYLSRLYDIKLIFYPYFRGKIIRQTRDFLLSLADYRVISRQTHEYLLSLAGYREQKRITTSTLTLLFAPRRVPDKRDSPKNALQDADGIVWQGLNRNLRPS